MKSLLNTYLRAASRHGWIYYSLLFVASALAWRNCLSLLRTWSFSHEEDHEEVFDVPSALSLQALASYSLASGMTCQN